MDEERVIIDPANVSDKDFVFVQQGVKIMDETYASVSYMKDVWNHFRKNRGAVIGLVVICLIIIMAIIGPMISGYRYDEIILTNQSLPPRIPLLEKLGIFNGYENGMFKYGGSLENTYHWFGCDAIGRDLFTRFCEGTKISLLVGVASALLDLNGLSASEIFGYPDDLKLRSCMTLFRMADLNCAVFEQVLEKYYDGEPDRRTVELAATL